MPRRKWHQHSQKSQYDHDNGPSDRFPRGFLENIRGALSVHVFSPFLMFREMGGA
jgi:hypothetical protein